MLPALTELSKEAAKEPPRGAGIVLLVDDEDLVRKSARRMLEQLGYTVHEAEDGKVGLERFEQLDRVDLVILDLVMPEMDGRETFLRLRELDADVRVLFASGYVDGDSSGTLIASSGAQFLQKPFNLHQLASAVAGLLPAA